MRAPATALLVALAISSASCTSAVQARRTFIAGTVLTGATALPLIGYIYASPDPDGATMGSLGWTAILGMALMVGGVVGAQRHASDDEASVVGGAPAPTPEAERRGGDLE